jgi:hypothetical protein
VEFVEAVAQTHYRFCGSTPDYFVEAVEQAVLLAGEIKLIFQLFLSTVRY